MPAHRTTNILIFGATGLIGEHITRAILASKAHFGRIGIYTSSNTLWTKSEDIEQLKTQGVEVFSGELTSVDAINEAYTGFDTVVSCVGRPVIHHQLLHIELAEKHPDIKRFLPSEYGTDIAYAASSAHEKPHQQKLRVRALLSQTKSLEYSYVVTGPYADADRGLYLSARPADQEEGGTFDVQRRRAVLLGEGGKGKISLTTMHDVGKLVVATLLHPDESRNRALRVNSFTTTPAEILAEFERQTGGQAWRVDYTPVERLKELEKLAWEHKDPQAGGLTLRRIWTEGGTLYEERDNKVIGMEDGVESLAQAVERAIEVQKKLAVE